METDLWERLTGSSAVQAICGQRVYWGEAPQGEALPYIVLHLISGGDTPHLRGTDGLWRYRVQVDCYAKDRPAVASLRDAVLNHLNGYSAGQTGLRSCFIDSQREDIGDAASARVPRIAIDFNITWRA